jgi:hypothetical protein
LNIELLQARQGTARNIVRLEKVNLASGERWVWQELEQSRLDLSHRKGLSLPKTISARSDGEVRLAQH